MLSNYSCVRLLVNRYRSEGASRDDIGTIIEVYADGGYEVEFSNADGTTYALIVVREEELELADPVPTEPASL